MKQEKTNTKKQQIITISIFSVIIILILAFFFFFLIKSEEPDDILEEEKEFYQAVLIDLEFLDENELNDLGLSSDTKAQVLNRDPLIYKIIREDEDIVEDIAPYLQPIRE
jgi:uncharacterized membrane protein YvbJ